MWTTSILLLVALTSVECDTSQFQKVADRSKSVIDNGTNTTSEIISVSDCGKSMGCLRSPAFCVPPKCDLIVTWRMRLLAGQVDMQFGRSITTSKDKQSPWIGLGFSNDTDMGDTSVVDCIVNNSAQGSVVVQASYNFGHHNEVISPDRYLGIVSEKSSGSYSNGFLTCAFTKVVHVKSSVLKYFLAPDLERSFIYLLAVGHADHAGNKHMHSELPRHSPGYINVSHNDNLNMGQLPSGMKQVQAHACLMIIAWMVLASVGIIAPRHFKSMWSFKLFGNQAWFQIHRGVMVATVVTVITAFVLIVIESRCAPLLRKDIHPILGLSTISLMLLNPVMALCRPAPDADRRPIFNWAHSIVGNLAHVMAVVTMYFGVQYPLVNLPDWTRWLVVAFGCWKIVVEILLTGHRLLTNQANDVDYRQLTDVDGETAKVITPGRAAWIKTPVFMTYLMGASGLAGALIYFVVSAYQ